MSAVFPKRVNLPLDLVLLPDPILPITPAYLEWVVRVVVHEATTAFDIGTGDGNEFPFHLLYGHGIPQRFVGRFVSDTICLTKSTNFDRKLQQNYFLWLVTAYPTLFY